MARDAPGASDTTPAPRVQVLVLGAPEYTPEMAALLDAMLRARQLGVAVVTQLEPSEGDARAAPTHGAFISLRLDSRDPRRWQLHLWRADRHWVRTLDGGIEKDAAAVEACALIAAQAVAALLEEPTDPELTEWEREGGAEPAPDDSGAAETEAAPPAPRAPSSVPLDRAPAAAQGDADWALSIGAGASLYAPKEQLEGSGVQPFGLLELERRSEPGWVFGAGLELALPAEHTTELGNFSLRRYATQLASGYRTELAGISGQVGLAVVLEVSQRSDTLPTASVAATAEPTHLRFALAPSMSAHYPLSSWTELGARATVAWFPSAQRFVAHGPDATELLAPYALRPRLDVLLSWLL